jgi:hypothetical protein
MSIELHTWDTPNGRNISVALEEMGLSYTVHAVNIFKGEQFDPASDRHPTGGRHQIGMAEINRNQWPTCSGISTPSLPMVELCLLL